MAEDNASCNSKKLNANKIFLQKAFSCLNIDSCEDLDIVIEILINAFCQHLSNGSSLVDNGDGTFTYVHGSQDPVVIDYKRATVVDNGDNTYTITDDFGTVINIGASQAVTTITNTVLGNKIADYTNEDSTVYPINETITQLTNNGGGSFSYRNEAGDVTNFSILSGVSTDEGNILTLGTDSLPYLSDSGLLENIGNTNLTIDSPGLRSLRLGGSIFTDTFEIQTPSGNPMAIFKGNKYIELDDLLFVGKNGSTQGALRVYGGAGGSSQIANFYNHSNAVIYEFRQSGGAALAYFKNQLGTINITLNASSGVVNANGGFSTNGNAGVGSTAGTVYTIGGGSSGDLASITIARGIITAVTTVP